MFDISNHIIDIDLLNPYLDVSYQMFCIFIILIISLFFVELLPVFIEGRSFAESQQ